MVKEIVPFSSMAEREDVSDDSLEKYIGSAGLHGSIAHILLDITCKSKSDIVEELDVNIELCLLRKSRETVFILANERYEGQLRDNGVTDKPDLQLKSRRESDSTGSKYATDIVELVLYASGHVACFPRDTISKNSVYVPLRPKSSVETGTGNTGLPSEPNDPENCVKRLKECEPTIVDLTETCKKQAKSLQLLWEYVLNVEKIVQVNATARGVQLSGVKELTPASSNRNGEWPLLVANTLNPQNNPQSMQAAGPGLSQDMVTPNQRDTNREINNNPVDQSSLSPSSISALLAPTQQVIPNQVQHGNDNPVRENDDANPNNNPVILISDSEDESGQRDGWTEVGKNGKKKKSRNQNKRDKPRALSGVKQVQTADMYLANIERHDGDTLKEIADLVKHHCKKRGLRVISARVFTNKFSDEKVGCKITIPAAQVDDALSQRKWPPSVTCRRWSKEPTRERRSRGNDDRSRGNDDRERTHQNTSGPGRPALSVSHGFNNRPKRNGGSNSRRREHVYFDRNRRGDRSFDCYDSDTDDWDTSHNESRYDDNWNNRNALNTSRSNYW